MLSYPPHPPPAPTAVVATGVEKDTAKARDYFARGCDGGFARGCANLGILEATEGDLDGALVRFKQVGHPFPSRRRE